MTTDTLDRDIIDVSLLSAEDHLDAHREYCRSVIAARCPEISEDEIAYSTELESDLGAAIWTEVAERVLDAVEALEERLDRLERTINGGRDDDAERGRGPDR